MTALGKKGTDRSRCPTSKVFLKGHKSGSFLSLFHVYFLDVVQDVQLPRGKGQL